MPKKILYSIFISLPIFLFSFSVASAEVLSPGTISTCGEINQPGTYTLDTSVSGSSCFYIYTNDVTIEGSGTYTITGDIYTNQSAVDGQGGYNITLKNIDVIGSVYTSGSEAITNGYSGGAGGWVTLENATVGTIYGTGGNGAAGATGPNGSDCNCEDGNGGDGGAGGTGGNGGNGARIILKGISSVGTIYIQGGQGGAEGQGGPGGMGGSNSGNQGSQGSPGSMGNGGQGGDVYRRSLSSRDTLHLDGGSGSIAGAAGNEYIDLPTIQFSSPTLNTSLYGTSSPVTVTASEFVGPALEGVRYYIDSVPFGSEITSSPFSTTLDSTTLSHGQHTLAAVVRNSAGVFATATVPFYVDQLQWTQTALPYGSWVSIAASSDGTKLIAVNQSPELYTSTDSGATWTQRSTSNANPWSDVASSADGTKLVAVANGYIYTSTTTGATWVRRTSPGSAVWTSVASSADGSKLIAGQYAGYLYTSSDSGATWTQRTGAGARQWGGLASSADGTKLVAIDEYYGGLIYTSSDSGATWTARAGAGAKQWTGVDISSDGTIIAAVSSQGATGIHLSNDFGVTWNTVFPIENNNWSDISLSTDGTKFIASSQSNRVFTSTDSGATLYERTALGSRSWQGTAMSDDGSKLYAIGYNSYLYTTTQSVPDTTAPVVSIIAPTNASVVNGPSVSLTADSSDNVAVAGVQFKVGNTNIGSEVTTPAYSTSWNSTSVADGSHTIYAVSRDSSNNYATSSVTVTVDNTGPTISAIASSTTQTTATITWTTNESATSTVQYGATSSYGSASSSSSLLTSHSFVITGLTAGTTYHFKLNSYDALGNLSTSTDCTFTTVALDTTPPSAPSSFSSNVSGDDVSLSWTNPVDSDFNFVTIRRSSSAYPANISSDTFVASSTGTSAADNNLADGTYYYSIFAQDNIGNISVKATTTATIASLVLSRPTVTVQDASSITTTGAVLNGTITVDGNASSTVRGFNYGTSTEYTATTSVGGNIGVTAFYDTVSDLVCNTTYHYRAYATNSQGTGTSSDATFTTSACPVSTPQVSTGGTQTGGGGGGYASGGNSMGIIYYNRPTSTPAQVTTTKVTTPVVVPKTVFTSNLTVGSKNNSQIFDLQRFLNSRGFFVSKTGVGSPGKESNVFGVKTKLALAKFQKSVKIKPANGYFGPITRTYINNLLK